LRFRDGFRPEVRTDPGAGYAALVLTPAASLPEKQRANAQRHTLVVPDPLVWQRLPSNGMSSIYLPPLFAPALMPAIAAIIEPFYMQEYRCALERCGTFMEQLTAMKHQLGASYDTTVRVYCILRLMLQIETGYYLYPTDLPIPGMPHLEVPPPVMTDEYLLHRLLSCLFDTSERSAAALGELGWTADMANKMVKDNISLFKHHAIPRFTLSPTPTSALPETHVWFWMYFSSYLTNRQHYLSTLSSLRHPSDLFIRKHGTPLVSRLASESRPELLVNLARRWAALAFTPPANFLPSCQFLLDRATTRFQHVSLRFMAIGQGAALLHRGKFDEGMFTDEVSTLAAICEASQFHGALAWARILLPADIATMTANRQTYLNSGQTLGAMQEDSRLITLLLSQDEAVIRAGGGRQALGVLKGMFETETSLWGGNVPRNSHESRVVAFLCNLTAENQGGFSLPAIAVVVGGCLEVMKRAVMLGRAPKWEEGQTLLWNVWVTAANYFERVYDRIAPSRLICEVMRDVAWAGVQDVMKVNGWDSPGKTLRGNYSTWVSRYAAWAPMAARFGDPAGLVDRLERLRAFLDQEVEVDVARKDYGNAIKKCTAIAEIALYDPRFADARTVTGSGAWGRYGLAKKLLEDEDYWFGKPKEDREEAAHHLRRVEGAWDAWSDPEGSYREPGAVRRPPGAPDPRDFWTYEWVMLATAPNMRYHNDGRMRLWEKKIQCESEMVSTKRLYDDYFEQCLEEVKETMA
jgi:hypothetical protein